MRNPSVVMTVYAALMLAIGLGSACGDSSKPRPAEVKEDAALVDQTGGASGSGGSSGADAGSVDAPACPASCDDHEPCTVDSCDLTTFRCVHTALGDGIACQGPPCTVGSKCMGGVCYAGAFKTCIASDQCHARGTCDQSTGECTNPNAADGTRCDDGDLCTTGDQCTNGVCISIPLCVAPNRCDADAGSCIGPFGEPAFPSPLVGKVFLNLNKPNTNALVEGPGGNVYLAATITGPSDLGDGPVKTDPNLPLGRSNLYDILVARIDPATAVASWVKPFFGQGDQKLSSFAVNGAGHIGLVGSFQGDFEDQGNILLLALTPNDQFIVGASATQGQWLWGRRLSLQGTSGTAQASGLGAIAADPASDTLVVCGTATKAATDLSPQLAWKGGQDAVVAAIAGATGETRWAMQLGGTNDDTCSAVAVDGASNVYVVGTYRWGSGISFAGVAGSTLRPDEVTQLKASWTFVAKLDSKGEALWVSTLGSGSQQVSATAIVPVGGDLLIAGQVGGQDSSTAAAGVDAGTGITDVQLSGFKVGKGLVTFLAKLSGDTGAVDWAEGIGQDMQVSVGAMAEAQLGRIAIAGAYRSAGELGHLSLPAPPSGKPAAFIAQLDGKTGIIALAKGYGDPGSTSASNAVGVLARPGATDADKDTTLMLTSFGGQINFGSPVGVVDSGTATQALGLLKLAP